MDITVSNIDRLSGNNLAVEYTMRSRLEADPDVDASYTVVTTTQTYLGITFPYFDAASMPSGVYVVHTYVTADGPTTGTKMTITVDGALT